MIASATEEVANTSYLVVYVLLGIMGLCGVSGLGGLFLYVKKKGKAEAEAVEKAKRDDETAKVVQGDPNAPIGSPEWRGLKGVVPDLVRQMQDMNGVLRDVQRNITRNGLNTSGVGDTVARTERDVGKLRESVDQHIGESREQHRQMWQSINAKADKSTVEEALARKADKEA